MYQFYWNPVIFEITYSPKPIWLQLNWFRKDSRRACLQTCLFKSYLSSLGFQAFSSKNTFEDQHEHLRTLLNFSKVFTLFLNFSLLIFTKWNWNGKNALLCLVYWKWLSIVGKVDHWFCPNSHLIQRFKLVLSQNQILPIHCFD